MKILVLTTAYEPLTGGAELAVKYIAEHLPSHEFTILTAKQKKDLPRFEDKGHIKIHRLGFGHSFDRHLFPLYVLWFYVFNVKRLPFDFSWAMMANQSGYAALLLKKICKLKYLLSLQEGDDEAWFEKRERLPFYKSIYTHADKVQAISQFLKDRAMKYGLVSEPTVIANGYDEAIFRQVTPEVRQSLRERYNLPHDALVFITASRLVEKNGIDLAIRAFLDYNSREHVSIFLIAGSGPLEESLKQQAGADERIRFLGTIDHSLLVTYMQASDVFIRLSRSEGLGSVFLEAEAVGLPVIATSVGGIPDVVKHEETGLLTTPERAGHALMRMENEVLREKLANGSLEFSKDFTWERIATQMEQLFQSLCE